jgi:hypothetical protein
MEKEKLLKFGNELEISGVVFSNGKESHMIMFPEATFPLPTHDYRLDTKGWEELLNQLDTLGVEGLDKTILRKSQRQIEQGVSWNVFRRDEYCCRYCGLSTVPLTVDHIVLWEHMGASTEDNLISACRKCNKTRGNMLYKDWLNSDYYKKISVTLSSDKRLANMAAWEVAKLVPLRNTQRSR